MYRLRQFYSNQQNLERVRAILKPDSPISLRSIDWLVTNYAKKHNISYLTPDDRHVIVYLQYKSHLRAYSKKMFDPFCRSSRITFMGIEDTTVSQLNFFRWALEDGVIDYLETNYAAIEKDMVDCSTTIEPKNTEERKKRRELSRSATRGVCHYDVRVPTSFD